MRILNETISVFTISIVLVIILFFQSCKTNDSDKFKIRAVEKGMFVKLSKHIVLNLNTYIYTLNISRKDAEKLEITNEFYDKVVRNVENMNEANKEILKTKHHSFNFHEYQNNTTIVIPN